MSKLFNRIYRTCKKLRLRARLSPLKIEKGLMKMPSMSLELEKCLSLKTKMPSMSLKLEECLSVKTKMPSMSLDLEESLPVKTTWTRNSDGDLELKLTREHQQLWPWLKRGEVMGLKLT
jgi:hypothetical protein